MRSRYKVLDQTAPHFITSTVVEWLPVFTSSAYCDVLIESLKFCREQKGLKLYAFVIMDTHIHLLAYSENLPRLMKEFKSFTALRLIRTLEKSGNTRLLRDLAYFKRHEKTESSHQF
jgi:REP element-mobilizing transposase RayT